MDITRLIENNCPKCKHLKNMTDKMIKINKHRIQYAQGTKEEYFYEGSVCALEAVYGELNK